MPRMSRAVQDRRGASVGPSFVKSVRTGIRWIKSTVETVMPMHRLERHFVSAVIAPILLASVLYTLQHSSPPTKSALVSSLAIRDDQTQCRIDSSIKDVCNYVQDHCPDFDDDGLIPYFRLYHCASSTTRPYLLVGLFIWLLILFASMAIAAGEFLSVHVGSIVSILGISENLAGVTLFAFGNGSSDLFSTLAAMNTNSGSLAINELFGAAGFIATVVFGLVAITRPFPVNPHSFVSDVIWFIISASSLTAFLADGRLVLGECLGIIGLYLAFVLYAVLRPQTEREQPISVVPLPEDRSGSRATVRPEQVDETTELLNSSDEEIDQQSDTVTSTTTSANADQPQQPEATTDHGQHSSDALAETIVHHSVVTEESQGRLSKLFPPIANMRSQSAGERILTLLSLPLLILICLTTPAEVEPLRNTSPSEHNAISTSSTFDSASNHTDDLVVQRSFLHHSWATGVQFICGFQLLALVFVSQVSANGPTVWNVVIAGSFTASTSMLFIALLLGAHRSSNETLRVAGDLLTSAFAFTVSLTWIYLTATSAVSLLKTLGFVLKIPTAILGATIFAIGNSSNDLVANTAVARRGFPVLAASACIGGPMMNMLLGIGIGGLVQVLKGSSHATYSFEVSSGLFLSAANLIGGLSLTLAYAFCNSWRLDARLGWILIATWSIFIVANVLVGITGS